MSKDIKAFPNPVLADIANSYAVDSNDSDEYGMDLRDYFAAKAMQGFCANHNALPTQKIHFDNLAEDAYRLADAMLEARSK